MNYFTTKHKAIQWANNYGLAYAYDVRQELSSTSNFGLYYVVWDYSDPN